MKALGHKKFRLYIMFTSLLGLVKIDTVKGQTNILDFSSEGLILGFEIIIGLLFTISLYFNYSNNRKLGNSLISLPFIYIFIGIGLTAVARFFIVLFTIGYYSVPPMVIGIYWHIFIYLSMISFLIAIRRLNERISEKEIRNFAYIDLIYIGSFLVITLLLFLTPGSFGIELMMMVMGTFIPEFGVLHLIAFAFTFILTLGMVNLTSKTRKTQSGLYINSLSNFFLLFLVLTTLNHFTALITESWMLLTIPRIEQIEQAFWILGFLAITIGYYKLNKAIIETTSDIEIKEIENQSDNVSIIMQILTDHIGNLAWDIFSKSSKSSGINPSDLNNDNIITFSEEVENHTTDLIGQFPSRFLKISLQKAIS